jgi:hypothetical protein
LFLRALPAINRQVLGLAVIREDGVIRPATEWDVHFAATHPAKGAPSADTYRLRVRLERLSITEQLQREEREGLESHAKLLQVERWRTGKERPPPDVRRCKNRTRKGRDWRHYFLMSAKRPSREFCSEECRGRYRSRKSMNAIKRATRERKLKRLRRALKLYRGLSDWKARAARRTGVTQNFIAYAIRRKEV